MLISDHYQNYHGPKLVSAILNNVDITDSIKKIYGPDHNWSGCLWTYQEIFGKDCYGKHFRFDFESDNHQKYWFYGFINDTQQYFNPPLHTPMNTSNN